jgi:hypothetical protein
MTCSGSPSLHPILEDSTDEFYMSSSKEGSSSLPVSRRCSMGTPPAPIATMPCSEGDSAPQTMMTVPPRTTVPQTDIELPPERWRTF